MTRAPHADPDAMGIDSTAAETAWVVDDPRVVEVVEQYRASLEAGDKPDRQPILKQFPQLAEELSACLDGLEFVTRVAPQLMEERPSHADRSPTAWKAARTLGDFRILREIGRGGMGVVYEAEQISLHRRVALKVLPFAAILDGTNLKRFKNEALAAATLDHPHIVSVYCVGCERGVHYYAMQFIEGQNLATTIRELLRPTDASCADGKSLTEDCGAVTADFVSGGVMPEADAGAMPLDLQRDQSPSKLAAAHSSAASPSAISPSAASSSTDTHRELQAAVSTARSIQTRAYSQNVARLGIQAARALDHAHAHGILHRDIKPSNLLIDSEGQLWVTDFGLARIESDVGVTMTGDVLGTLRYMCPETAAGGSKHFVVDQRADIYSLGVTLYELLTLQPAFQDQDRKQLFQKIVFTEPRPPRRISKAIPTELETIVLKAMRKDPADRYATAGDLANDLQRFLNDEPIRAKPPTLLERTVMWSRRHRTHVAAGAILLAMFVVSLMVTTALVWREQQKAEQREAEAWAVVDFLANDLLLSAAPEESLGREVTVNEVLANAEDKVETEFNDQPLVEAYLRGTMGEVYYRLGKYELAEPHLAASLEIRNRLLGDGDLLTLWTKDKLAVVLMNRGQLEEARQLLEQTVALSRRELGEEDDSTLVYMNDLALVLYSQGDLKEARKLFEHTLEIQRRVVGEEHRDTLQTMNNLANAYADQGQLEEARQLYEKTLEKLRALLGEEHPQTLRSMGNLALVLSQIGQLDDARILYEQTLEITRRVLGEEHPDTLDVINNLANLFMAQGQFEEAGTLHQQLLEVRSRILGEEHSDTIKSMNNLALVFMEQGQLEEASRLFERAVQISRREFGTEHVETASWMFNLANAFHARGQLDEARELYEQTQEIQRRVLGADHPDTLDSMNNLAEVLRQQGQLEEAGRLHEQTLKDRRRILGAEDRTTLASMNNLALVFRERGQLDDARSLHEQTLEIQRRVLGKEHRETLRSMTNLAKVIGKQGHLDDARRLHEQALEMKRRVLGEEDRDTLVSMDAMAPLLNQLGDWNAYFKLQEQIFDVRRRVLGDEHPETLLTMNNLAWSLVIDPDKPFADAERAVELASKAVELHPENSAYLGTLGLAHYRTGDLIHAIEFLEKAADSSGHEVHDFCCLAMAHWQLGHEDEARRYYDQALQELHFNREERRLLAEAAHVLGLPDPFATNSYPSLDRMTRQPLALPIVPAGKLTHIDLQPVANRPLTNLSSDEGNDLNELPRGEQTFAGVKFRIGEKLIQLGGPLNQAKEIRVGMKIARLYLLQATQYGGSIAEDAEIAVYRVHFRDASSVIIPVTFGKDVRDWWNNDNSMPVSRAVVAWEGTNPRSLKHDATLRLYVGMWENPQPEIEVSHIEYVTANTAAAPFCVAMTVEESPSSSESAKTGPFAGMTLDQ